MSKHNNTWIDYGNPIPKTYICSRDSDEWIEELENYGVEELKNLQRLLTYITNKALFEEEEMNLLEVEYFDCCKPAANEQTAAVPAKMAGKPLPPCSLTISNCTIAGPLGVGNQKENTMNINLDADTRNYLNLRLNQVNDEKVEDARSFFLPEPFYPKTGAELKKALADGWLTVSAKDDTQFKYSNWAAYVSLRDPALKYDEDGWKAALNKVDDDYTKVRDAIMVKTPADALAALNAFEGTTYH